MNKLLELFLVGITTIIFGLFLIFRQGFSFYNILLFITGIGMLLYGLYKKKEISDYDNPEVYDERDEVIQNKASNIILTVLTYVMLIALLLNSFTNIKLDYIIVLLIILTSFGKQLTIKIIEKYYDN